MASGSIVEVAPIIGLPRTRDRYDYMVGPELRVQSGDLVRIKFRNSKEYGVVLSTKKKSTIPLSRLAPILEVHSAGRLTKRQLQFAIWISQDNHTSLGQVLKSFVVMPPAKERYRTLSSEESLRATNPTRHEPLGFFQYSSERTRNQRLHKLLIALIKNKARFPIVIFPEVSSLERAYAALPDKIKRSTEKLHGSLSKSERFLIRKKIISGKIGYLFGTSIALFEPLPVNKLIVVDDEQNQLYKQSERQPHYQILRLIRYLVQVERSDALFMGVFPSIEVIDYIERCGGRWLKAISKNNIRVARVSNIKEPEIRNSTFGHIVEESIRSALAAHKQILLYYNQRTRFPMLYCLDCSWRSICPSCQRAMITQDDHLICASCSVDLIAPVTCPQCKSARLSEYKNGVEFIAEQTEKRFPKAKIKLLPESTDNPSNDYLDADIIIGTSRALRLPLPNNRLIIVLSLDRELHRSEWWAKHYFIYVIRKLASLSPRLEQVMIQQSEVSDQGSIALFSNDSTIIRSERAERLKYNFPPAVLLVKLTLEGERVPTLAKAETVRKDLASTMTNNHFLLSVSPVYFGSKYGKDCRCHILLKFVPEVLPDERAKLLNDLSDDWHIDVMPISLD